MKLKEGTVRISEHIKKFLKDKTEKDEEKIVDFSQVKPVKITDIRKLMPCTADPSMSRIVANMIPPLGGALKLLLPLFPRCRYIDRTQSLMIHRDDNIITVYSSGKVSIGMIKNEIEAGKVLEELRNTINEAIIKGVVPAPREKHKVEVMDIHRYLPQTNCGICKEQDCHSFAEKLMAGEVTLEKCKLLKEAKYAANNEHLQVLTAYI